MEGIFLALRKKTTTTLRGKKWREEEAKKYPLRCKRNQSVISCSTEFPNSAVVMPQNVSERNKKRLNFHNTKSISTFPFPQFSLIFCVALETASLSVLLIQASPYLYVYICRRVSRGEWVFFITTMMVMLHSREK